MPVLGNLHNVVYCQVTVFETIYLEASRVAVSVEDDAKRNGGIDLCRVPKTHTGNTAYQYY